MIIEKILGNLHELPDRGRVRRPAQGKGGAAQRPAGQTHPAGHHGPRQGDSASGFRPAQADLRDGDILHVAETNMIVVSVLPTDVLVIAPRTIHEMGVVAHSLGNRHLQAQFFDAASEYGAEVMVCQYDHTVEDYLKHVGVPYDRQERVMPVPFRHAEHSH